MRAIAQTLRDLRVGPVLEGFDLAEATTYKVGGPAAVFVNPNSVEGVAHVVAECHRLGAPCAVVGWGSNLVVSDAGFAGVVVRLGEGLRHVEVDDAAEPPRVRAGAATMNNHLVRSLHKAGFSGPECLALVPGTVGGAVAMNAGTRAGAIGDFLLSVRVVRRDGVLEELPAAELGLAYRTCRLPAGAIVVEATLAVKRGGVEAGVEAVKAERAYRNVTQPYSAPSAGSVFTNPPGDYAGRLIEAAGLKGATVGGAQISPLHANFIVTESGATAADVVRLMALARAEVRQRFGVTLEPEQRLLGFGDVDPGALLDALAAEEQR
jgi:UDP-N-acetylmuramate dehydrogenase